ncbi:hypothetical protein Tco_0527778 [Tanacetum coccineum]
MLEDFSSNSKGKRTYAYTILFLELKTLNVLFFCQNLQFCWSQTSHTNSSDEILKPFFGKGFSKHVSQLVFSSDKVQFNYTVFNLFFDEMIPSMDVLDNATYSAYADDIAVQSYFFDIQLTNLSPRNCIPPKVLLRESMHPAWSASKKAVRLKPEPFEYQSPM